MISIHKCIYILCLLLLLASCRKSFLEIKPQRQQVIVETLNDVEALLDNASTVMNVTDYFRLISDGDLHFTDSKLVSLAEAERNLYCWNKEIDPTGYYTSTWDLPYQQIFYANIALETLEEMDAYGGNQLHWNALRGRALFFRAWAHYQLLQDFAEGFDVAANDQLGIPIILDSSFPKDLLRAPLKNVYEAITRDLEDATLLLPSKPQIKTHPSKQAVFILMARVYQNLNRIDEALVCAEKALEIDDYLLDFNDLYQNAGLPFLGFTYNTHPEIVFFVSSNYPFTGTSGIEVNASLYESYDDNDLRKANYFDANGLLSSAHAGSPYYHFTGLSIDEVFLIKAECLVRMEKVEEALQVLELLLSHRYKSGTLIIQKQMHMESALNLILSERQKELVGRGIRWTDLKRLNRSSATQTTLTRTYQGKEYKLLPNDTRYVFEIPRDEIERTGIAQNLR